MRTWWAARKAAREQEARAEAATLALMVMGTVALGLRAAGLRRESDAALRSMFLSVEALLANEALGTGMRAPVPAEQVEKVEPVVRMDAPRGPKDAVGSRPVRVKRRTLRAWLREAIN